MEASERQADDPGPAVPETTPSLGAESLAGVQRAFERSVLGGDRRYTQQQAAELAGVATERAQRLWQALGFAIDPDPDAVMFTDGDVQALRNISALVSSGAVAADMEMPAARSLGQSMSRLAEWQVSLLNTHILDRLDTAYAGTAPTEAEIDDFVGSLLQNVLQLVEQTQMFVWRRHLVATTERNIVSARGEATSRDLVVGFADMVGYTRLTRRIEADELSDLLEEFESAVATIIAQGRGWVIKTVGDEVMFAAEDPVDGARIALTLQESFGAREDAPDLRVGLAWGPALARFGDLFGSVVNIAARLTGVARPGTILVDSALADRLESSGEFEVRSIRNLRVKDFHRLRPSVLRAARS
ncbi:adenylate/guanylate cyclase domain-containing protein [Rhodococcus zopfii]|uniref:adenylate/guanylate cyclase domain-containing protein n=1 Tax=Rhodococcus zopfii TaxID=43772 RepID=UPI001F0F6DE7|nr:adenylate/guanylate cyclase domain-containing protein [Rhodococcus zopfii]